MILWLRGGAITALLVLTSTTVARADDACWRLVFAAMQHEAAAAHAAYTSYSETVDIMANGHRFQYANVNVVYRNEDGLAYIDDERLPRPIFSDVLEPGPPVLGPYGADRESWLPAELDARGLPVIASVRTIPNRSCTDEGNDDIDGSKAAHLVLGPAPAGRPALEAIWVDRLSLSIPRLIVSGYVFYRPNDSKLQRLLVEYQVDTQTIKGYTVVKTVRWNSSLRTFSQSSNVEAVYTFGNYRFEAAPPFDVHFRAR